MGWIMAIPLVSKEDIISPRGMKKDDTIEIGGSKSKEKDDVDICAMTVVAKKRKLERPVRILRIRYYEKIFLSIMRDRKLEKIEAIAVNRGLEDLLNALGYNTRIDGKMTSHDCILVEKGDKMGVGNKFLFVDIGTNDFYTLKKQMENHTTICAFNQGEFMIIDGKRSSLTETFDIPYVNIDKNKDTKYDAYVNMDKNKLVLRERLRKELKGEFKAYHSYDDDQIDTMKEPELIRLKRLASRKMEMENVNRKFYGDLLK